VVDALELALLLFKAVCESLVLSQHAIQTIVHDLFFTDGFVDLDLGFEFIEGSLAKHWVIIFRLLELVDSGRNHGEELLLSDCCLKSATVLNRVVLAFLLLLEDTVDSNDLALLGFDDALCGLELELNLLHLLNFRVEERLLLEYVVIALAELFFETFVVRCGVL
jgi:hypothetical protein